MNLDVRAARATRSLRASVAHVSPVAVPAIVDRRRRSISSFAVAVAAVLLLAGVAAALPDLAEEEQIAVDTTLPGELPVLVDVAEGHEEPVVEVLGVHKTNAASDSPEPYTIFYGSGAPGSVVTAVSEYGSADTIVGEDGQFEVKIWFEPLPPAGVQFPIVVTVDGTAHEFGFVSLFDPATVPIAAHQQFGISDDAEAFDIFFGTAPADTVIVATSDYGSADAVADPTGRWELKLWFQGPLPLEQPFPVTVMVGAETFVFEFVSVYSPPVTPDPIPLAVTQINTQSDSPEPYVLFAGTAPVGTHLLARSEFGAHDLQVGESGEFELKLWFTSLPPAGVEFPIFFEVDGAPYATYPFTSWFVAETGEGEPGAGTGGGEPGTGPAVGVAQITTSSDSPEPFAKFVVEAPVGTVVAIASEYGSMTTTMETDRLEAALFFSVLPPPGVEFPITVTIDGDLFGTYPFTSWFDPAAEPTVTVVQYNTVSDSPDPWVKFTGTAPVGTLIEIVSEYGSWSWNTEAIEWNSGQRFFEPLPPTGQEFLITVRVNGDTFGTYGFTSLWDPNQVIVEPIAISSETAEPFAKIEYYGPAGTSFQLQSPYGNSDTITLAENGSGHLALYFSTLPPAGIPFEVDVFVNGAWHSSFAFTSWYEPPA
jgi:hypothetical protein